MVLLLQQLQREQLQLQKIPSGVVLPGPVCGVLAADYGYLFLEKALARLAAEFAALAPEGALAARISDVEALMKA